MTRLEEIIMNKMGSMNLNQTADGVFGGHV